MLKYDWGVLIFLLNVIVSLKPVKSDRETDGTLNSALSSLEIAYMLNVYLAMYHMQGGTRQLRKMYNAINLNSLPCLLTERIKPLRG
jgi:hypothetical protein